MDWIAWVFLESPRALAVPAGIALFVALVLWRRNGRPRPLLITAAVVAVLFGVQWAVLTRREAIDRVLRPLEKDLRAARVAVLDSLLTPDFVTEEVKGESLDRRAFLELARHQLQYIHLHWLERHQLRVMETTPDTTHVRVWYLADISLEGMSASAMSGWNITFRRTAEGWKIASVGCRHIGDWRSPSWRGLGYR